MKKLGVARVSQMNTEYNIIVGHLYYSGFIGLPREVKYCNNVFISTQYSRMKNML